MILILDDINEIRRVLLRDQKTKDVLQLSEELWEKECAKLQKDQKIALVRSEDIPQNRVETPLTSVLKNGYALLRFLLKQNFASSLKQRMKTCKTRSHFALATTCT